MLRPLCLATILLLVVLAGCMGAMDEAVDPDGPLAAPTQPLGPGETDSRLEVLLAVDAPRLGDPDAPVTVVAYDAPGCFNCRFFHNNRFSELVADYVEPGHVAWRGQPWTIGAAYDERGNIALACVHREGGGYAYWPYLSFIYGASNRNDEALREELARSAAMHGYDEATVLACYDGAETRAQVQDVIQAARQHGASGSPVFFVLGPDETRIVGMNALRQALDNALVAAG
jgi:protein-disulfide isomerase